MSKHRRCYVINCEGEKKGAEIRDSIGFYKIPCIIKHQDLKTKEISHERRRLWLKKLRLSSFNDINKVKICSRHFFSGKPSRLYDKTNPDWLPNLCLGDSGPSNRMDGHPKVKRHERRIKRSQLQRVTPVSKKQCHNVTSAVQELLREYSSTLENDLSASPKVQTIDKATSSISEDHSLSLWDESKNLFNWNETGSTLTEENHSSLSITEAASSLFYGINLFSSPPQNSNISLPKGHNFKRTFLSNQTSQRIYIDNTTQVQPEYVECSTQTEVILKDFGTQMEKKNWWMLLHKLEREREIRVGICSN